jgi:poly(A) polymerase
VTIPKRFSLGIRDMYAMQPRLEQPRGRRALRTLEMTRFRAAFDLLLLRAQIGMAPKATADWWTRLQEVSPEERNRMVEQLERAHGQQGGREEGEAGETDNGPRRRRRRRRPAGPA